MPAVVVTARVDAAADVQVNFAQVVQLVEVLVAARDGLGQRQAARIGQAAKVTTGAGDHVGQQADVGACKAGFAGSLPQLGQLVAAHPRQHQVLVMRHAHFTA